MKLLIGVGVSVLIVAGGVATYHWIAGDYRKTPLQRYGIRSAGMNARGQPVITDSSIDGTMDDSEVRR